MRREPDNFNLMLEARSEVLTCLNFIFEDFPGPDCRLQGSNVACGSAGKALYSLRHQLSFRLIITNLVGPGHPHVPAIPIF
jgi:hypothetical protein